MKPIPKIVSPYFEISEIYLVSFDKTLGGRLLISYDKLSGKIAIIYFIKILYGEYLKFSIYRN